MSRDFEPLAVPGIIRADQSAVSLSTATCRFQNPAVQQVCLVSYHNCLLSRASHRLTPALTGKDERKAKNRSMSGFVPLNEFSEIKNFNQVYECCPKMQE